MTIKGALGEASDGVEDMMKPVAVVGIACRFPDDATSSSAFYDMLANGRSAWSEVPKNRFNIDAYYHPSNNRIGSTNARGAHWMKEDPAAFDAPFSGLPIESLVGSDTSIYVGSSSSEYAHIMGSDIDNIPLYAAIGSGVSMLANRISHFYDLRGPSVALDTACSSGLVATHLGCQSIRTRESKMSMIAASQLMLLPDGPVALSRLGFLGPDGRCYTFDDRANGYARGEGICVMLLKDLDEAILNGDAIRAVIRGSGTNQDGKTPGIVQPNSEAQEDLIRATYKSAGIEPKTTHYFEAHGTGTRIGDPLELNAVVKSLHTRERSSADPLYIGSVKTNIGHLEGAAGLAGLLKAILSLENGVIVPHINFSKPNPSLPLEEWNLRVPTELTPWPVHGLRRASVNSFGYGGSNAHCIVDDAHNYLMQRGLRGYSATVPMPAFAKVSDEELDSGLGSMPSTPDSEVTVKRPRLYVLSSPEQAALQRLANLYTTHVRAMKSTLNTRNNLANLAFTLGTRRSLFQWRMALVADSVNDLASGLESPISSSRSGKPPKSIFVFNGQGAQWHAMGRELLQYEIFARTVRNADKYFKEELQAGWSVLCELIASEKDSRVNMAKFSQPLCVILQTALVDLLHHWGVHPSAVIGHSSGEIAGAYAAGALSVKDCWKIAYHRGRLSQNINSIAPNLKGAMMSVGLSAGAILAYLNKLKVLDLIVIACNNSPSNITLSGDNTALEKLEECLKSERVFTRRVKVDVAYHSPHMKVIAGEYLESIRSIQTLRDTDSAPIFYSSVTGDKIDFSELDASYWVRNMTSPVQFFPALGAVFPSARAETHRRRHDGLLPDIVLELGPHSTLQGPVRQILTKNGRAEEIRYYSMLHRGKDAIVSCLEVLGNLWTQGQDLNFLHINSPEAKPEALQSLTDLPRYPWNHTNKFWHESRTNRNHRQRRTPRLDLLGYPVNDFNPLEPRWVNHIRVSEIPWLADYKRQDDVIFSPASMICAVVEAGRQIAKSDQTLQGFEFRDISFGETAVLPVQDRAIGILVQLRRHVNRSRATESEWQIFTVYSEQDDDHNIEHCSGLLQVQYRAHDDDRDIESLAEANDMVARYHQYRTKCKRFIEPRDFYQGWGVHSIHRGPQFQGLVDIRTDENIACTTTIIQDTRATVPEKFEFDHLIHPTTLDACFQGIHAPRFGDIESRELTSIKSIYIAADVPKGAGSELLGYSTLVRHGFKGLLGSVVMSDKDWTGPKVIMNNLSYTSTSLLNEGTTHKKQPWETKKVCSNLSWKADIDHLWQDHAVRLFALGSTSTKDTNLDSTNENSSHDTCNSMTKKWLELSGHKKPYQRILEISDGSTSLSLQALEALGRQNGSTPCFGKYVFTTQEVQSGESARNVLKPWEDRVEIKQLDVERNVCDQGFEKGSFDVILGPWQAFQTVKCIEVSLSHCSELLRPGGRLVLSETSNRSESSLDSRSVLESSDISRLDEAEWSRRLIASGFSGVEIFTRGAEGEQGSLPTMMVTSKQASPKMKYSNVIIVHDQAPSLSMKALSCNVFERLTSLGINVELVSLEQAVAEDVHGKMLITGKALVSFLEAEIPLVATMSEQTFGPLKKLLLGSVGGMWVTRSNRQLDPSGDPAFSSTVGLLRVHRNENPDARLHELALSSKMDISSTEAANLIVRATKSIFEADSLQTEVETEYGEVDGQLYIPRIYDEPNMNNALDILGKEPPTDLEPFDQRDSVLRLDIGTPGQIETLRYVHEPLPLEPIDDNEVEIVVRANGLNFFDDVIGSGSTDSTEFGFDAAGIVKRVGRKVSSLNSGDRVAALCNGAFRSVLRTRESLLVKLPDGMSLEEGASLPAAYTIAYQALFEAGRLAEGETLLIHSAAGGIGQAAIKLAKFIGANIFATAGSSAERQFLINEYGMPSDHVFSSRNLSFAKGLMRLTDGKGVDVVLNSLSGEGSRKTWECTAMFGRFIELGKEDILDNSTLEMSHFLKNITFSSINLEYTLRHKPKQAARMLHASFDLIKRGAVGLIKPITVYPYKEMKRAFSAMKEAEHVGGFVLKAQPQDLVPTIPREPHPLKLKEDATYVILGGLGGIGRYLTLRLAEHGAQHIAFFSRSGASKPKAKAFMQELGEVGVKATSYICDIADTAAFEATMARISTEKPPINCVIHATMVLNDEDFTTMTYEQWIATTRNKIQGGLNMHRFMPTDMDFCVLMSSIAPIMGNGTQSNYAAGNSFLDGLAWHRRSLGLPACALNFGFIAGIGWAAENVKISDKHRADYELSSVHPPEVWALIESAITGYQYKNIPMPPQMGTCAGSGGQAQKMRHIETWMHYTDPKYMYIRQLDVRGEGKANGSAMDCVKELKKSLMQAKSLEQAADVIEGAIAGKLSRVMFMAAEDIDTEKPVDLYGVDSLIATEIRNWIFDVMRSAVSMYDLLHMPSIAQLAVKAAEGSALVPEKVRKERIYDTI